MYHDAMSGTSLSSQLSSGDHPSLVEPEPGIWFRHWLQLDRFLADHAAFWRPVPFTDPEPAWRGLASELAAWTDALTNADCERFAADLEGLADQVAGFLPGITRHRDLVSLPDLSGPINALPEARAPGMPGRKRLQAGAFTGALQPIDHPVLDWCCGKGHLARTLATHSTHPVTGFEWNERLVQAGNRITQRFGEAVALHHQDVMAQELSWPGNSHVVALHACGDLHRHLLKAAASRQVPRLSLSPCCYQKSVIDADTPLSQRVRSQADACNLTRNERQLAVEETVTAPRRERRQTDCMRAWRLGFDGLQRYLSGIDTYLQVPSHPARLQRGGFANFCRWAAQEKGLALPAGTDFEHWRRAGEQRLNQVRRHELIRHLFRRPLELWLVLDLVLFLEEQGYQVKLGTFCERALTPRNLLIDAELAF